MLNTKKYKSHLFTQHTFNNFSIQKKQDFLSCHCQWTIFYFF